VVPIGSVFNGASLTNSRFTNTRFTYLKAAASFQAAISAQSAVMILAV